MLLSGSTQLFEVIFFNAEKNWLTNGFRTLVGFQGRGLKIAEAVLCPKKLDKLSKPSHLDRGPVVSQTNDCIWFIIRSRLNAPAWPSNREDNPYPLLSHQVRLDAQIRLR